MNHAHFRAASAVRATSAPLPARVSQRISERRVPNGATASEIPEYVECYKRCELGKISATPFPNEISALHLSGNIALTISVKSKGSTRPGGLHVRSNGFLAVYIYPPVPDEATTRPSRPTTTPITVNSYSRTTGARCTRAQLRLAILVFMRAP